MAGKFDYYYKNGRPYADLSKWSVNSGTSCRLIGQPTVTWDNLGSLFFKNNYYAWIIGPLLNPNQNLYNVIQFCENNPNCVQIEIDKGIESDSTFTNYSGHHIFASCPVDLKKLIESQSVTNTSTDENVTVKWICNYGPEQEATLNQFLTMIQDLETDPQKCGITYKQKIVYEGAFMKTFSDTSEEHKHLSFFLDLRRYCGDTSGLSHRIDDVESEEQLIDYVDKFHKKYVKPNTPPSQQIVWTFLRTLGSMALCCQHINKNLKWDNVKKWDTKLGPVIGLFNQMLPGFLFHIPEAPTTDLVESVLEQFHQLNADRGNKFAAILIETLKSTESSFIPSMSSDENALHTDQVGLIAAQIKAFLERKHLVQNAEKLVEQIKSPTIEDRVIFAIYKQLFKTHIIKDLKDPDSKAINILSFLIQNVQKNGLVASISVPDSGGKKLILVVNNLVDVKEEDMKPLLFDLVKRKAWPVPFVNSHFSLFFDNKIHADLSSIEAFNLFKTIVPDENVDRIDGIVVTELSVRETAADIGVEGVAAGIKFLALSHMFLTHYYDNQFFQNVLKSDSDKEVIELIKETTKMLTNLRESVDKSAAVKDLQQEIESLTPNLFQLSTHLQNFLTFMKEGVGHYSSALQELNQNMSSLIESEKLPKKSSI